MNKLGKSKQSSDMELASLFFFWFGINLYEKTVVLIAEGRSYNSNLVIPSVVGVEEVGLHSSHLLVQVRQVEVVFTFFGRWRLCSPFFAVAALFGQSFTRWMRSAYLNGAYEQVMMHIKFSLHWTTSCQLLEVEM